MFLGKQFPLQRSSYFTQTWRLYVGIYLVISVTWSSFLRLHPCFLKIISEFLSEIVIFDLNVFSATLLLMLHFFY